MSITTTGHWIEECALGEWSKEHALLSFTQLNTAHNGIRLGQALYVTDVYIFLFSELKSLSLDMIRWLVT
jgi:hypothetical protein